MSLVMGSFDLSLWIAWLKAAVSLQSADLILWILSLWRSVHLLAGLALHAVYEGSMRWLMRYAMGHMHSLIDASSDSSDRTFVDVALNVYSVGHNEFLLNVNELLYQAGTGIFHAGLEIHNKEWSFGAGEGEGSGIRECLPTKDPGHLHYKTISMGKVRLSREDVLRKLELMSGQWQKNSYNIVDKNCCHFVNEFLKELGLGGAPEWLLHSTEVAAKLDTFLYDWPTAPLSLAS